MNQICQKNNATKSKEAEERKKGLLEHVWEGLAAPKLSGHTYVKWNDSIERLPGKDNRTDEWALNADPASTLSSYKFLCPICVMRIQISEPFQEIGVQKESEGADCGKNCAG